MQLKEFVTETLVQVADGVVDAQTRVAKSDAYIDARLAPDIFQLIC